MLNIPIIIVITFGSSIFLFILGSCLLVAKRSDIFSYVSCQLNPKENSVSRKSSRKETVNKKEQVVAFGNRHIEELQSSSVGGYDEISVFGDNELNNVKCVREEVSQETARCSSDNWIRENDTVTNIDTCAGENVTKNVYVMKTVVEVINDQGMTALEEYVDNCSIQNR